MLERIKAKTGIKSMPTLIQCDFDGTVTENDVSFLLLDAFANGDWRQWLKQYREGKINVGRFNTEAFAMVKADRQSLVDVVQRQAKVRPGFHELVNYCHRRGFRFVIVSNGLDFYIDVILNSLRVKDTEVFAAQTQFSAESIKVKYVGPDGSQLHDAFKESYARLFQEKGYRVIYVGNGFSDMPPAKLADWIFARDELLSLCREANLNHTPFNDFNDVVRGLELLG